MIIYEAIVNLNKQDLLPMEGHIFELQMWKKKKNPLKYILRVEIKDCAISCKTCQLWMPYLCPQPCKTYVLPSNEAKIQAYRGCVLAEVKITSQLPHFVCFHVEGYHTSNVFYRIWKGFLLNCSYIPNMNRNCLNLWTDFRPNVCVVLYINIKVGFCVTICDCKQDCGNFF